MKGAGWWTLLLLACSSGDTATVDGVSTALAIVDGDGDGFIEDDCNDADASVNPGVVELCDGIDNNCDGQIDEDVTSTWYTDGDGDGYGGSPGGSPRLEGSAEEGGRAAGYC